jgi:hypothetical protein
MNAIVLLGVSFVWLWSPPSNQWESAQNWSPAGVPTQNDSASFLNSERRNLNVTMGPKIGPLEFNGRQDFRVTVIPLAYLTLNGPVSFDTHPPTFVMQGSYSGFGGQIGATKDSKLEGVYILHGYAGGNGAEITTRGSAGDAHIYANAGTYVIFRDSGNAGTAKILSKPGGTSGLFGGQIYFYNASDAPDASIILAGGTSALQIQEHLGPVTVGRLSGPGTVFLGPNTLRVKSGDFTGTADAQGQGGGVELGSTFSVHLGRGAMSVNGAITLGGKLEIYFNLPPGLYGHTFTLFRATGPKSGAFESVSFPGLTGSPPDFVTGFSGNDYQITFSSEPQQAK